MFQIVSIGELANRLGVCKATIHAIESKDPTFPPKVKLTPGKTGRVGYRLRDVESWLDSKTIHRHPRQGAEK